MKPVIIIPVLSLIVLGVVGFLFMNGTFEINEKNLEKSISGVSTYTGTFDCAKHWDEIQVYKNRVDNLKIVNLEQTQRIMDEYEELGKDFFKNECASTVNDWAYKTQDEWSVWYGGMDWELFTFIEKEMNERKLSPTEIGEKYLRESSVKEPVKEESEASCGAGTEEVNGICQVIVNEEPVQEELIDYDSKCGAGTHYSPEINSCVLD